MDFKKHTSEKKQKITQDESQITQNTEKHQTQAINSYSIAQGDNFSEGVTPKRRLQRHPELGETTQAR